MYDDDETQYMVMSILAVSVVSVFARDCMKFREYMEPLRTLVC